MVRTGGRHTSLRQYPLTLPPAIQFSGCRRESSGERPSHLHLRSEKKMKQDKDKPLRPIGHARSGGCGTGAWSSARAAVVDAPSTWSVINPVGAALHTPPTSGGAATRVKEQAVQAVAEVKAMTTMQ